MSARSSLGGGLGGLLGLLLLIGIIIKFIWWILGAAGPGGPVLPRAGDPALVRQTRGCPCALLGWPCRSCRSAAQLGVARRRPRDLRRRRCRADALSLSGVRSSAAQHKATLTCARLPATVLVARIAR